jgi:hypothetical protein
MRPVPTATNTSWPIQSSGPDIIVSVLANFLAVSYPYTARPAHRGAVKRRQARYKLPQLAHDVHRYALTFPLAREGNILLLLDGPLPSRKLSLRWSSQNGVVPRRCPHSPLRGGIKVHTLCEDIAHLSYEEITRVRYALGPSSALQSDQSSSRAPSVPSFPLPERPGFSLACACGPGPPRLDPRQNPQF